jgi:hypothetical protein
MFISFFKFAATVFLACNLLFSSVAFAAPSAAERHRIDLLLSAIEKQQNLVFIRNGSEHPAGEAASHLRRKMRSAEERISTAEEFIDNLATASSLSGKPYMVRRQGMEPEPAGPFLHRLLRNIAPGDASGNRE